MKETRFIEQNQEKWSKFEKLLSSETNDPDMLSDFFIQITDDLSYARTFYKNRSIRVYLNNICQQLFYKIYKNKKKGGSTFWNFWRLELPMIVYRSRKELLTALSIFILSVLIGVVSSIYDPEFSKIILGDSYVNMTIENIQSGDPMAVYKKMNEVDMFLGITFNNVRVAFITFLLGILFTIGSVAILIQNGIMVGTFQYFFIERDLFADSFLTIWLHGTLEISSIIIAGGAGIVLGKGLIAPGTFSRIKAFQISAKQGLKLLLGIVPILVFAALIESFLTRYTEVSDMLRLSLILISFLFVVVYFVIYPIYLVRKGVVYDLNEDALQPTPTHEFNYEGVIKTNNEVIIDLFNYLKDKTKPIIRVSLVFALIYIAMSLPILFKSFSTFAFDYFEWYTAGLTDFFNYAEYPYLYLVNVIFFTTFSYFIIDLFLRTSGIKPQKQDIKKMVSWWINIFIIMLIVNLPFFIPGFFAFLIFFLLAPILFSTLVTVSISEVNFYEALNVTLARLKGNYQRIFGLFLLLMLIGIAVMVFINSPFPVFYLEVVTWNVPLSEQTMQAVMIVFNSFISAFSFLIVSILMIIGFSMKQFSLDEIISADGLRSAVQKMKANF